MLKKVLSKNTIIYLLLFLTAMNFYSKFFYFAFASFILMFLLYKNAKVDLMFFVYLILSFIMAIYNMQQGFLSFFRTFAFPLLYCVGFTVSQTPSHNDVLALGKEQATFKTSYKILFAITLGVFVHFFLNFIINIGKDMSRNTLDVWTNEIMSATLQAGTGSLALGLAVALIITPKNKKDRVLGFLFLTILLVYNMILAGRTMFVILLILLASSVVFLIINSKNLSKALKPLGILILVFAVIAVCFVLNLWGIKDYIVNSNFYQRFFVDQETDFFDTGRMNVRKEHLSRFFHNLLGGLHVRKEFGYAHDLLLDAHDEYGIFVFLLLIVVLCNGIINIIKFCRNKKIILPFRMSFLCVYIVFILEFMVEPIFAAMPWLFACFAIVNGCLVGVNKQELEKKDVKKNLQPKVAETNKNA